MDDPAAMDIGEDLGDPGRDAEKQPELERLTERIFAEIDSRERGEDQDPVTTRALEIDRSDRALDVEITQEVELVPIVGLDRPFDGIVKLDDDIEPVAEPAGSIDRRGPRPSELLAQRVAGEGGFHRSSGAAAMIPPNAGEHDAVRTLER
jgi:hypothetical protein